MISTYVRIAIRSLRRQGTHTAVNLMGLALGIAAAYVIGIYVSQELTYDRGFEEDDRIYRVATDFFEMGGFAKSQSQLLDHLPYMTPSIETATRFDKGYEPVTLLIDDRAYEVSDYLIVDSAFFDVFSFQFQSGSSSLLEPGKAFISDKLSERLFGDQLAVGRSFRVDEDEQVYQVAGIVESPTFKTHLVGDLWLPMESTMTHEFGWANVEYYNYVKTAPEAVQGDIEAGLHKILESIAYPASGSTLSFEEWSASPTAIQFWVQPLTDIYLHSDLNIEISAGGNASQVYILGLIGLLILILAGFNYINLTTAASFVRLKEIGVKQSMGGERTMLIQQFMVESMVFSLAAMVLAVGLSEILFLLFESITGKHLLAGIIVDARYLIGLVVFSLVVGQVAGLYPALYLSSIKPATLFKGFTSRGGPSRIRNALVVSQFAIAIILITGSVVVYHQLNFMKSVDKGFDHERVLVVNNLEQLGEKDQVFKDRVEQLPIVQSTSIARRIPTGQALSVAVFRTPEMAEGISIQRFRADEKYISTLGMRLLAGRNFSGSFASDSTSAIVNESAVRALGLGDDPIGKEINPGMYVIGVVSDFNYQSLRTKIEPVVLQYADEGFRLALKLEGGDTSSFLSEMETVWTELSPEDPISYYFLDENVAALVRNEDMLGRAIALFTLFAVLIACMGLFGLTIYSMQRRMKEIGVRKILGATVPQLVGLLSRDFLQLVALSFVIAAPIAYVVTSKWLEGFAYRIDLGAGVFIGAGLLACALAFITISYHAIKASLANPVEIVRYE